VQQRRILVVEDEMIVAMDIAQGLRRLGYEVTSVVDTGERAMAAAEADRPDLILMDIRLKGSLDGIDAARIIRRRMAVPVVFLTAYADATTVERSKEVAPYGYLVKPFDERDLHRAVELAFTRAEVEATTRHAADEALWQSEEKFRLLVDAVEDYAMYLIDLDGRIVSWNRGAERITGYTEEDVLGMPLSILYADGALDLDKELVDLREKGRVEKEEWRARKDGTRYLAHVIRTPTFDRNGQRRGFASVSHNITEQRALESQMLQMQKLDALGKLAGGIAHDFNNMLMVIFSRCDLLRPLLRQQQPQSRFLEDIVSAAKRSRDMTQQLLAAARRQVLTPEVVDLGEVLASTLQLLSRSLGEHITIRTDFEHAHWPLYVDPSKLHQVVLNLALNARDAMPRGGTLSIETRNVAVDALYTRQHPQLHVGDYVALIVSDTGTGIPVEIRDQIYDPFFSTKEASGGTGLGLAVVRGIVERSGGAIWMYSENDRGTTFKVFLPRHAGEAVAPVAVEEDVLPERGTETILLVEDEDLLRTILAEALQEHGYEVLAAANAAEALAISRSREGPLDLLLTDVVMPGMSGRVLAEQLTSERPDLRVVYMSGYTDDAMIHNGVLDAKVHFLEKPVATSKLVQTLRAALH